MKTVSAVVLVVLLSTSASAFVVPAAKYPIESRLFDAAAAAPAGGRINTKIDLDSPKVATMDKLAPGDKRVYCRCWRSGTFPLCDAAHVAHNKETGDNVGPLIVSVPKEEE